MNSKYCCARARTEIRAISTFCVRAMASRRSRGPSKPSTSTTRVSPALPPRLTDAASSQSVSAARGAGASLISSPIPLIAVPPPPLSRDGPRGRLGDEHEGVIGVEGLRRATLGRGAGKAFSGIACKPRRGARDLTHLGEIAAAMQRQVAARSEDGGGACRHRAVKRRHADIVAHHQAFKSDQLTNHFGHYNGGDACGSLPIEG